MPDIKTTFQTLIDNAVKEGVAPGFQCVVFNRDEILFNGVSGFASLPSDGNPAGTPMSPSTLLWVVSCTKLVVSLVALHVLEQGLIDGVSLDDLDNPDALSKIVPEFAPGSGSLLTKIIDGFEDHLGPDGKKIMKLRDATKRITLRHLLTHSSGIGTPAANPLLWELMVPSDGSVPLMGLALNGALKDYVVPLLFEPGTGYHYGFSADWLAQFLVRGTGKDLRKLFKEFVFDPLGISMSEIDLWLSPEVLPNKASYYIRDDDSPYKFKESPIYIYSAETLGEGMTYSADSGLFSSSQAYAKVLQAVLNKDPRIMSPSLWEMSFKDDFGPRGLRVTRPDLKSMMTTLVNDIPEFSKTTSENGNGMNLLQCKVALAPTLSGRPAGSFGWTGMPNVYYFVDPTSGVGGIIGVQLFPLFDSRAVEVRDRFESLIYETIVNRS